MINNKSYLCFALKYREQRGANTIKYPQKRYCCLEGSFRIPDNIWHIIYVDNKLVTKYYPFYFRNRIARFANNTCTIVFKDVKYARQLNSLKIYAKCKQITCKLFQINMQEQFVKVYSTSLNFNHKERGTAYVNAVERDIFKNKSLHTNALTQKKKNILEASLDFAENTGNLQGRKSDCCMRKIRSEPMANCDRDRNDILDLIKMHADHKLRK